MTFIEDLLKGKPTPVYIGKLFLLAAIYFIIAKIGLAFATVLPQASTIWPASGVALAALLLYGFDLWPAITIGAFAVNATTHEPLYGAAIIAIGNTAEAIICVQMLEKFRFDKKFERSKDVIAFGLSIVIAAAVAALMGTTSLLVSGIANLHTAIGAFGAWGVGDLIGMLLVAPFLLTWLNESVRKEFFTHRAEALSTIIFCFVITAYIFFAPAGSLAAKVKFLVFPFLIWGAFRLDRATVATLNLGIGVIGAFSAFGGGGIFNASTVAVEESDLLFANLFVFVAALISLLSVTAVKERDEASAHIRMTEKRLRELTRHSTDGIILVDQHTKVIYTTLPASGGVLGYTDKELLGKSALSLVHVADQGIAQSKLSWLLSHPGKSATLQMRGLHKKGHWVWLEVTASNMFEEPAVQAMVLNYRDVTERRQSEEKIQSYTKELERSLLRNQEEVAKEEALLSSLGDGFIATDRAGNVIFMNPAAENMLHWSVKDVVGRPLNDALPMLDSEGRRIDKTNRPIEIALASGKTITTTTVAGKSYYYMRQDGSKFPVAITVTPVVLNGEIIGAEEIFKDITYERQVDRAKTEFVSLASHQLRTPLAIVSWYTEALLKGKLGAVSKQQNQYLRQIYTANQRLVSTVNNLLNVSRLEMGTFPTEPTFSDVRTLVLKGIKSFEKQAEEKNLIIQKKLGTRELTMFVDKNLFAVIVDNLVSNAVKYTTEGGKICISLARRNGALELEVKDSGLGIPKSEQDKVFGRFYRGSNVTQRSTDGNGLGLYIVKRIVEFMGGKIRFASEENKGTTFFVSIPIPEVKDRRSSPRRSKSIIMTK